MGLQLGDTAPDFTAQTTEGTIRFHEWIGDSWAVLFSHPKDFTPICTTELGSVAKLSPEFQRRNVKLIGLSVDSVEDHDRWLDDIEETQGTRPDYPIIADTHLTVSKLYGMLEADHAYLLDGGVFTPDLIRTWLDYKRASELDPIRLRPHPHEFELYFDV